MNVLIISPFYAPFSGVGAARMVSLSKFLRDNGVSVTVMRDAAQSYPKDYVKSEVPSGITIIDVYASRKKDYTNAYMQALDKLFSESGQSFDLMIVSCGPYYTIKAVTYASEKYHVKFILDFRDLWVHDDRIAMRPVVRVKNEMVRFRNSFVEKKAVQQAHKIVVVTPGDQEKMRRIYPRFHHKFELVYNGYDDQQLVQLKEKPQQWGCFTIGYFGKLTYYSQDFAKGLLTAVDELNKEKIAVKIIHINQREAAILEMMEKEKLDQSIYENLGAMDYLDGMSVLQGVTMCAMIHSHSTAYGTKIFDYIYLNKPIISVSPKGTALSNFVESFENGFVCSTKDEIMHSIKTIIEKKNHVLSSSLDAVQYSRSIQNKKYYALINESLHAKS